MKTHTNNSVSQYALIVCMGIALLFGQAFKLHMHIQHDEVTASAGHIVDVHAASSLYNTGYDAHHQDDIQDHHSSADIDVSPDSFVKKISLFKLFVLFFFVTGFILYAPQLLRIHRQYHLKTKPASLYYLFHPPLRAPPSNFSV